MSRPLMRAAVYRSFGGPIQVELVPRPTCKGDDSQDGDAVVIQVMATGVCRSDWHGWKGHDDDIRQHGLPFIPGHELAGVVVETSAIDRESCDTKTETFRVGDRVAVPFILSCGACHYCQRQRPTVCLHQEQPGFTQHGSMAEFVRIPRARHLCRIPDRVSFVQAAALGCRFTTAYRAVLQQGQLQPGQTVVVFGAGGLGLSCITLAAAHGAARIVAVDISVAALDKAMSLGATHTILAGHPRPTQPFPGVSEMAKVDDDIRVQQAVSLITDGLMADLSLDAAGFKSTCENAVYCTARGGRMVQVGLPIGQAQDKDKPLIPMGYVAGREIEVVGSHGFAAADLSKLLDLVATGKLDPSLLVERQVGLEEGARTLEDMDRTSPLGITMVLPSAIKEPPRAAL